MVSGTQWTEAEDQIIRETYPFEGADGTSAALSVAGYDRKPASVKARASVLKVRKLMRKARDGQWSGEENEILKSVYPKGGAEMTRRALLSIGSDRSVSSIRVHATVMGISYKRRREGETVVANFCLDSILDAEIIKALDGKKNRSAYIRNLILSDIGKK